MKTTIEYIPRRIDDDDDPGHADPVCIFVPRCQRECELLNALIAACRYGGEVAICDSTSAQQRLFTITPE